MTKNTAVGLVRILSLTRRHYQCSIGSVLFNFPFQASRVSVNSSFYHHQSKKGSYLNTSTSNLRVGLAESQDYFSTVTSMANANGNAPVFKRLPQKVVPVNYDLTFEPDWTTHTFQATAAIDVEVKEATDAVVVHAVDFTIASIAYRGKNDDEQLEAEIFILDLEQEVLKINFPRALPQGNGTLTIAYSGKVKDNLRSFFRSKYKGSNGEERFHYATKFEPTYARGCFPCWDEPSVKATYDITLVVPKNLVALSNMPVKSDVPHPTNIDRKIVKFERSVKMSTYVMAFAIGEFDFVEGRTPDGILCRVYTPVGKKERGTFALEVVMKSLGYYKKYFGIPYPLPKMDLLAVAEFGSGAMENWGLVIFRENVLLVDDQLSSVASKQATSLTVAHETAHMWFGNLVTMEWWSDLWLNEGYASFMEYLCVDKLYPEFEIWNWFMGDYISVLEMDASATSHPIQVDVENPADIGSIFDFISYVKGAAIIRMVHDYLGDDKFKEGMSHYLSKNLFGNAETKDLWAALTEKSGEKIDVIMPTFTEQMGFPVFTVKDIEQSGQKKIITLSYQKFWLDSSAKDADTKKYRWITPVTIRKKSDPTGVALKKLINEDADVEFKLTVDSNEGEWVKLNADHIGYYRVIYPSAVLQNFIPSIKSKELQSSDRLGILDDLFATVEAGRSSSDDVLKFMLAYINEESEAVWSAIFKVVGSYDTLLRGTSLHEKFKAYALSLLSPTAKRLGWNRKENENSQDSVLRTTMLTKMVSLGCVDTIEEAKSMFAQHIKGDITISPDVKSAVYRAVATEGESGFDAFTDFLDEKVRIIAAMGSVKDKQVIQKVLEFGRSNEVNMQDIVTIIMSLSSQGQHEICWEYFKENWQFFRDNFPTGHFLINRVVKNVTSGFKSDEKAAEIENFFKENQIKGVGRSLSQSLEKIRIRKVWLERDTSCLQTFLSSY
ncbi:Puromycin-sensitive aminopeptidase [Orchesella cincta]|uniref:Aminopeptidase n=1 Tax=Orchesella cincta TaxID=48709 RepID=A0A1D2NKE2_ORCCI|nr:Puromycin-sensitive aminopeptidase [Orchesella cincta]